MSRKRLSDMACRSSPGSSSSFVVPEPGERGQSGLSFELRVMMYEYVLCS